MANRRPQIGGRRMDYGRNERAKNFRGGVSPWQGGGPGTDLPNLLPLGGGPTEATLALASNLINLLQPRQNTVPSLLDMPIRRDFGPTVGRYDRAYVPNRMGNQGNFRRTGNYNRAGERINTNRKPFRPNDGPKQQNKNSQKKDADSKAKTKESEEDNKDGTEATENKDGDKKDVPKTRYDDINSQLLKCHICNKSMWDGRSFENHLNGRAHAIMMQKTAESYALTADTMRQEFKIREMKRTRKAGQQPPRDFYCAMCDMYAADGAIHRTTVGHRKLKKYLHPTCVSCHKEMPTRIELDEHRLTAEHLKVMQDKQEVVSKPKPEVMVISTLTMEQMYLRDDRHRGRRSDRGDHSRSEREDHADKEKESDEKEVVVKKEDEEETSNKEDGDVEVKQEGEEDKEEKKGVPTDNENTILDFKEGDDITVTSDMIPVYSTERGVGESFLREFRCVQCGLCRKLLDSAETAAVHLRTWRHHQLFVRALQERITEQQPTNTDGAESNKRPLKCEESGNWKRRKTSQDEENEDQEDQDISMKEEQKDNSNEEELLANGNNEITTELPAAEDLEDWEASVDEILNDENKESGENAAEEKEQEEDKPEQEVESKDTSESPTKAKGKATRGRGRGRRRY